MIFYYSIIFIFGLVIGSFLNCVIYRLEKEESFLKGRSYCPHCKHQLSWQDLIPVLSFFILKGKCRYCGKPISYQYPLVEIGTGILFLLIFNFFGFAKSCEAGQISISSFEILNLSYLLLISSLLIIIFVYDFKHYIIPDRVVFPAIAIVFFYQLFTNWNLGFNWNLELGIWSFIASAFLASGFFLSIILISRGAWMGLGDVKLAFLMGLLLGFPNIIVALFLAFLIGAIIGIGLIISKKKTVKSEVPFGPFLVIGTFIAMFWGEKIISHYFFLF